MCVGIQDGRLERDNCAANIALLCPCCVCDAVHVLRVVIGLGLRRKTVNFAFDSILFLNLKH